MSENDTKNELTRKQIRAIGSLLAFQTVAEAAKDASVSEKTLYRWMQSEPFAAELRARANQTVDGALRRLTAGRDDALDTIHGLMTDVARPANVRRLAAVNWLDILHRTIELDEIERRLTALEEKLGDE